MRYQPLPQALYTRNRANFASKLAPGACAVLFANELVMNNGDGHYRFAQNSNFFYLTGIDQEDCILFLFPDSPRPELKEVLFIRRTSPQIQLWEGWKYSPEEAMAQSGIGQVRYFDEFEAFLRTLVQLTGTFYLDFNEHERNELSTPTSAHRLAEMLRREYPAHQIARAWPLLTQLRMQKAPEEIEQLRKAIAITESAFRRVAKFVKPGVMEYEVEAEVLHEFVRKGATGPAYEGIFGSGKNGVVLHYILNHEATRDGELILMDFGAEYGGYSADLTRTIPVNGRFSARQKAVYQAVLDAKHYATGLLKPGTLLVEYQEKVGLFLQEKQLELGLLTKEDVAKASSTSPAYKKYFPHGTSHHLGLDTHDVHLKHLPLAPGMVLTCEPGLYIPEEGIGIRIEDDILITETDNENLMLRIPSQIEEIEALMASR